MSQEVAWPFSTSFIRLTAPQAACVCMCVCTHWVGEDPGRLSPRQQYLCNEAAAPGPAEARPGLSHLEQKR